MLLLFHSSFCWFGLEVLSETSLSEWLWVTTQSSKPHTFNQAVHAGWMWVKECTKCDVGWIIKNVPLYHLVLHWPCLSTLLNSSTGNFYATNNHSASRSWTSLFKPKVFLLQAWPACDFWTLAACEQFPGQFWTGNCATGAGLGAALPEEWLGKPDPALGRRGDGQGDSWGCYCPAALWDCCITSTAGFQWSTKFSQGSRLVSCPEIPVSDTAFSCGPWQFEKGIKLLAIPASHSAAVRIVVLSLNSIRSITCLNREERTAESYVVGTQCWREKSWPVVDQVSQTPFPTTFHAKNILCYSC